jgi:hypothetical protein
LKGNYGLFARGSQRRISNGRAFSVESCLL